MKSIAILCVFLCLLMQIGKTQIGCSDGVTITDTQYKTQYFFDLYSSYTDIQVGFYGASGAFYFVSTIQTTRTAFSKEDAVGNLQWAKIYTGHYTYQKGNVLLSDESKIYSLRENSASVVIFEISATDGSLLNRYEE